jgi:hypothetical protein
MLMISLCGRRDYWLRSYFAIKSIHEKGKAKKYLVGLAVALLAAVLSAGGSSAPLLHSAVPT